MLLRLCETAGLELTGRTVLVEEQRYLLAFLCDFGEGGGNEFDLGIFGSQTYGAQRALWAVDDDSGSRVTTLAAVGNITTERKEELLELRYCVSVME